MKESQKTETETSSVKGVEVTQETTTTKTTTDNSVSVTKTTEITIGSKPKETKEAKKKEFSKCICKLRVDELKKSIGTAATNVSSLLPILPDLSKLESLSENMPPVVASENISAVPSVTKSIPVANLSESESKVVSAAEQLSAAANMQASVQAQLGVNLTSTSAPKALGGIIEAAQLSGLINVLEVIANFKGLNLIGAIATGINSLADELGVDLLADKVASFAANNYDKIADKVEKGAAVADEKTKQGLDIAGKELSKVPSPEELADKAEEELPGKIGEAVKMLNDYVKGNPGISRKSLADLIIDSLGNSLLISLDDVNLTELVNNAIEQVNSKFTAELTKKDADNKADSEDDDTDGTGNSDPQDSNTENGTDETKENDVPDLLETVKSMVKHNLQGRSEWDSQQKALEALEKLKELEELQKQKLKEYEEKEEQRKLEEQKKLEELQEQEDEAEDQENTDSSSQTAADSEPKTVAEQLLTLIKKSKIAGRNSVLDSVKAANSAIKISNDIALLQQRILTNPALAPETADVLKSSSESSSKNALDASDSMANTLKSMKHTIACAQMGDLEGAIAAAKLTDEYATKTKIANEQLSNAKQKIAQLDRGIQSAEDQAADALNSAKEYMSDEETQRVIASAIKSAQDAAGKAFGGDLSSPMGLSVTARAIASININGPAITMISSTISTAMLLKAMANLSLFLLVKDVFGDSLLSPSGGSSIAASFGIVASAAATASASASAAAGAGAAAAAASASAGVGAGASAAAGAGASAGVSASATASLSSMSGLLAGTPPSPIAILLLTAILGQLAALGHNVVASSPCRLSLEAIAGNNIDQFYNNDDSGTDSENEKKSDTSAILNNLKSWLGGANHSQAAIKSALGKVSNLLEMKPGDLMASGELSGVPSLKKIDANDLLDSTHSSDLTSSLKNAGDLAGDSGLGKALASKASATGLDTAGANLADRAGAGLAGESGLGADAGSTSGSGIGLADSLGSNLTDGSGSNSGSGSASDLTDGSEQDSDGAESDPAGNRKDDDSTQQTSSNGNSTGNGNGETGAVASSEEGSDDSSGQSGESSDSEGSGKSKSSLGGKVAVGVAAGAVGAAGIGVIAAASMRGKGNAGTGVAGSGGSNDGSGASDGVDSAAGGTDGTGNAGSGAGDGNDANAEGSTASGGSVPGGGDLIGQGSDGEVAWYQKARHGTPSRDIPEDTYAVGDPSIHQPESEKNERADNFDPEDDEEGGDKWYQQAKHDKPSKMDSDNDFDIEDVIDKASDLDDSDDSSKS